MEKHIFVFTIIIIGLLVAYFTHNAFEHDDWLYIIFKRVKPKYKVIFNGHQYKIEERKLWRKKHINSFYEGVYEDKKKALEYKEQLEKTAEQAFAKFEYVTDPKDSLMWKKLEGETDDKV